MDGTETYCRFCAEQKQHDLMTNLQFDPILLNEILEILCFVNAYYIDLSPSNHLPKTLCMFCYEALTTTSEFLKKAKTVQKTLNDMFLESSVVKSEFPALTSIKIETLEQEQVDKTTDEDSNDDFPLSISNPKDASTEASQNNETIKPGTSWTDYPWSCSHCTEQFTSITLLRDHSEDVHGMCCAFQCADCSLKVDSFNALVKHARGHRRYLRYYCEYCNLQHDKCSKTKQHTDHHKTTELICYLCGKIFSNLTLLYKHKTKYKPKLKIYLKAENKRVTRNVLIVPTNVKDRSWSGYPWQCQVCSLELDNVQKLRCHAKEVHSKCFVMKCVDCLEEMQSFRSFVDHVLKHRPFLKNYCQYCNIKFDNNETEHISTHFTGAETVCEGCGEILKNRKDLLNHMKAFNPPKPKRIPFKRRERPITVDDLTCNICNKVTKSLSNLYSHKQLHTERNRDYTCDRCGKAFFTKGTLSAHYVVHENRDPQICKICKKTFLTVTRLKKHITTHYAEKSFQCDTCQRSFRLKEQLKCHMIIHSNVMPYHCSYCNKTFRHRSVMKTHENQHTGARPYMCEQCGMDFTNWSNCNKHMKRKHGTTLAKSILTSLGKLPLNPSTGSPKQISDLNSVSDWRKEIMEPRKRGKKTGSSKSEKLAFDDSVG